MREIKLSHLIDIFHNICRLSITKRSEKSSAWDFDLSIPFLNENRLGKHIKFVSRSHKKLPLNSEQHLYDMSNIVLCDLEIDLDDRSTWQTHGDWEPLSNAKWHFEKCRFVPSSSFLGPMNFPWRGSFRFYKNEFEFQSHGIIGSCLFTLQDGSWILFQGNDFKGNSIQTSCVSTRAEGTVANETGPDAYGSGHIAFIGNNGIASLSILEGYSFISFTGMNRIGQLMLHCLPYESYAQEVSVYFGPRERIDPDFHYCFQHRKLFTSMRRFAALNQDTRQLNVLDKQLERIEYHLNKEQDTLSVFDFHIWSEYWQDRLLHAWRRWSSNFYRSWVRPLVMIVSGYMLLNALPALFIDTFSFSHWLEFTLRPIGEIAGYESALRRIVGDCYQNISASRQNVLRLVGLIEVIWIAMWSFSFARSIRR